MKKPNDLNPLSIAGVRKFTFLPPHLVSTEIAITRFKTLYDVEKWIEENLVGRYWTGTISKLQDNKRVLSMGVAFEEQTELTLFLLGCPHI
jgi:hypothetical protein